VTALRVDTIEVIAPKKARKKGSLHPIARSMVSATTAMARSINTSSFVKNAPDDYKVRDECKKIILLLLLLHYKVDPPSVMVKQESVYVQTCQSK
jgi:hypothetical protein